MQGQRAGEILPVNLYLTVDPNVPSFKKSSDKNAGDWSDTTNPEMDIILRDLKEEAKKV